MKKNNSGFSLIELLVAAALLLVIIGPLLSFMRSAQLLRANAYKLTDVEQNARAALLLIGRDIQNTGYNFPPKTEIVGSTLLTPLLGTGSNALSSFYPIIPGNNINQVYTSSSTGAQAINKTDQLTLAYTNQRVNGGLPIVGTVDPTGRTFTLLTGTSLLDPTTSQQMLNVGDFCILNAGQNSAIGIVSQINGTNQVLFSSGDSAAANYGINNATDLLGNSKLGNLDPLNTKQLITIYSFYIVTYFVDSNGNLIRREHYAPPHTTVGGVGVASPSGDAIDTNAKPLVAKGLNATYTCNAGNTCYYDNIIATGIEDLQFTYSLVERTDSVTKLPLTTGPVDDPGFYGAAANGGNQSTNYRLLDIRRINVFIRVRAQERDNKLKDPYDTTKKTGYLYRFSLEGSYNTRNFYGSNYKPT
jgi:prepilin-type N-terminal cleavage/methylation domain-containing protein